MTYNHVSLRSVMLFNRLKHWRVKVNFMTQYYVCLSLSLRNFEFNQEITDNCKGLPVVYICSMLYFIIFLSQVTRGHLSCWFLTRKLSTMSRLVKKSDLIIVTFLISRIWLKYFNQMIIYLIWNKIVSCLFHKNKFVLFVVFFILCSFVYLII